MYHGAFDRQRRRTRRRHNGKSVALLAAVVMVLGTLVGTTVAYLFMGTDSIVNTFTPSSVTVEIDEKFDNKVKNDVTVKNTGDVDAYIRAAVVVTWQDSEGQIYPTAPVAGTDYTVSYPGNGWQEHNGYYYYTSVVAPEASTGILLTACKPVEGRTPDGYHLVVEILASAIQSEPETAIQDAWKVTIDKDGNVKDYNPEGGNA